VKRPKHVIIITDYAWVIGGASKVAMMSAIALAERGYDTHHFSVVGPVAEALAASGVSVHCLGQPSTLDEPNRIVGVQRGLWNRQAAKKFERLLSRFPPGESLVHVHQWTKALSPSIFETIVRLGFRFVVTLHDYFISCPNGGFLVYKETEICERKPLSVGCVVCNCDPRNYGHKVWRVFRQVIQNQVLLASGRLTDVIYVSEFSRAILSRHLPDSLNWYYVPNPVQASQLPRVDVTANRHFVFVGRLSKEKGGHLFAEAAKLAGVPAVFVGDGEQRKDIQRRNGNARITGWLLPDKVYDELRRARALVFPSIWYEMQGLTVVEAASMGVPSIVGDRSAARDYVRDGASGLYMNGASIEDLAAKLTMLQDDAVLDSMSRAAYDDFWQRPPTIDAHMAHLERTYATIFARQAG